LIEGGEYPHTPVLHDKERIKENAERKWRKDATNFLRQVYRNKLNNVWFGFTSKTLEKSAVDMLLKTRYLLID
jgi:hypothetical protein